MKEFLNKLTSRKFIACMIGVIIGIATTFGVDGGVISDVAGLVVAIISSVSYIIVEGNIDAKAVSSIIDSIEKIEEIKLTEEKTEKTVEQ